MPAHQVAIGGELDIGFNTVGAYGQRMSVCGASMFGVLGTCPTVRKNFHGSEASEPQ